MFVDLFDWLWWGDIAFSRIFWQWIAPIVLVLGGAFMAIQSVAWWGAPLLGGIVLWLVVYYLFPE